MYENPINLAIPHGRQSPATGDQFAQEGGGELRYIWAFGQVMVPVHFTQALPCPASILLGCSATMISVYAVVGCQFEGLEGIFSFPSDWSVKGMSFHLPYTVFQRIVELACGALLGYHFDYFAKWFREHQGVPIWGDLQGLV